MSWLFLFVSLIGLGLTINSYRPIYAWTQGAALSFFAGWLTTELALHHIAWQLLAAVVFVQLGALHAWPGVVGLTIAIISWAGLAYGYWSARGAEAVVDRALCDGLGRRYREHIVPVISNKFAPSIDWRQILLPFPMRHPEVERIRDLPYAAVGKRALKLDVYRHRSRPSGCPTLLQIHGGGWVVGSKNQQGIPLMLHLAARGWMCISVDYRLSPRATFPDHLIDLKRALRWVREHGAEYGADPNFVVVTGGSAGGHLCALVALTANDSEYQPGFEAVDTSVQGCVAFYGIYDFLNRNRVWRNQGLARLLARHVMKVSPQEDPAAYEKASPISRITASAPPFFVIHGDRDTLVPVREARHFCAAFRRRASAPLVYAELPGAQHAFEIFPSLRTAFVIHGVERFLACIYSQHLLARQPAMNEAREQLAGA